MNAIRIRAIAALPLLALTAASGAWAKDKEDPELDALRARLEQLEADPTLGALAGVERLRVRQALESLAASRSRQREEALWLAQRRVEIAELAAWAERDRAQSAELDRERDRILLDAARRDADLAQREAERLRALNLARAEEAQRAQAEREVSVAAAAAAQAEADQARKLADARQREASLARREASLATAAAESLRLELDNLVARSDQRGQYMVLSGEVFAPGQAELRPQARDNLARLIDFVQRSPRAKVRIEGHTDATGGAELNQKLSLRRAQSVRQALIEEGVAPARLEAVGLGQTRPVAGNDSAEGRARNRRVEVVLQE